MLPVCSAAPSGSSHSHISVLLGSRPLYQLRKAIDDRYVIRDRSFVCTQDGIHDRDISFRTCADKGSHSLLVERPDCSGFLDSSIFSPNPNEFDDIVRRFPDEYLGTEPQNHCYSEGEISRLYPIMEDLISEESSKLSGPELLDGELGNDVVDEVSYHNVMADSPASSYVELSSAASPSRNELPNLPDSMDQVSVTISDPTSSDSSLVSNATTSTPVPVSDTVATTEKGLSNLKDGIEQLIYGINESIGRSISRTEDALRSVYDGVTLSVLENVKHVTESFDNAVSYLFPSVGNSKEQASNALTGFSSALKDNVYSASTLSIDILRRAIVTMEDSLGNAATFVVYSYASSKSLLPPNVRDVLNSSEEKVIQILRPVGASFQQVYVIIEGFEKNLGLDPNDPIVPFILLLGSSAIIGISYWFFEYSGYSGNLAPELTLELLKNDENAVLVDVRPEDLRERDGIPDLRRGARSKYASVTLPEIDGSLRKQLKSGADIKGALISAVICNLKIVKDDSKVIVMDANGGQSKTIARYLRRLGVKKPYLVQGGFQAWVTKGLRIKELKPETTLTVLNEEAEAILEDIRPTPALVIGYALGISAATYAILEWEKTLQLIGLIGLGQTLYRRVASYEDSEDLKQDVRLLLAPVRLGGRALSWAASKLEPNKIGLPTSPSSTAVQDRVLQAAAKHESQPSDSEEGQGIPRESSGRTMES